MVEMCNNHIQGTETAKKIQHWKKKNCAILNQSIVKTDLGESWFRGFICQLPELHVVSQTNANQATDSWWKYYILKDMYDHLFQYWFNAKCMEWMPHEQWQDIHENAVGVDDPSQIGRKVKF